MGAHAATALPLANSNTLPITTTGPLRATTKPRPVIIWLLEILAAPRSPILAQVYLHNGTFSLSQPLPPASPFPSNARRPSNRAFSETDMTAAFPRLR